MTVFYPDPEVQPPPPARLGAKLRQFARIEWHTVRRLLLRRAPPGEFRNLPSRDA